MTPNYSLYISKTGDGNGQVTVNGNTYDFPYSGAFPKGTTVNLEAKESVGSKFTGWSDGVSTNPRSFVINNNTNLFANFQKQVQVNIYLASGNGTIKLDGIPHNLPYNEYLIPNTYHVFEAVSSTGYRFTGWTGDAFSGTANPVSGLVTKDISVGANFKKEYKLTIGVNGSGWVIADGELLGSGGTKIYLDGQKATLSAIPSTGYKFVNWSGNASGTLNPIQINIDGDKNITANFNSVPITFITDRGHGDGAGERHGDVPGEVNAQPAATVTAAVTRVSGDTDITVQSGATLTFTTATGTSTSGDAGRGKRRRCHERDGDDPGQRLGDSQQGRDGHGGG